MTKRLVALLAAALVCSCGNDDSPTVVSAPLAQWGRARADTANTGIGATSVTNTGLFSEGLSLGAGPIRTTPAIGIDGTVFVATETGAIIALDPNLNELWRFAGFGPTRCSPAVDPFNNVYIGTEAGIVGALDSFGQPLWPEPRALGSAVVGSPLLLIDNFFNVTQALFVGTEDGRVVSLGGTDGQVRWQFPTGGAIRGSLTFAGLTLYAPSADQFLYSLTQQGSAAFPKAALGAVLDDFSASPSVTLQNLLQTGLADGRVRGFSTAATAPLWDVNVGAPVSTSGGQFTRVVTQRFQNTDGTVSENNVVVIDFLVLDDAGNAWLLSTQTGSPGTRCIGGPADQQPCRTDQDCIFPDQLRGTCQPIAACEGGENDGHVCRRDDAAADCPGGTCEWIATCTGGTTPGKPCRRDDGNEEEGGCGGGVCDLSLFTASDAFTSPPVTTAEGTIFVTTSPTPGTGILYAIEPPSQRDPLEPDCNVNMGDVVTPRFCRFAFAAGEIQGSPAVAVNGTIYFGDDGGILYSIGNGPS